MILSQNAAFIADSTTFEWMMNVLRMMPGVGGDFPAGRLLAFLAIACSLAHPQTRQAHIAALKAMDPRYAKASDASILRAMPDAMLAMPATPATTNGITNA